MKKLFYSQFFYVLGNYVLAILGWWEITCIGVCCGTFPCNYFDSGTAFNENENPI